MLADYTNVNSMFVSCRSYIIKTFLVLFLSGGFNWGYGQILSYTTSTTGALNSVATNATGIALSRVNGATTTATPCSTGFSSTAFSTATSYSSSLPAIEVSVSPNTGYGLNVTGFQADMRRSGTGPSTLRFAYTTDGGTTWIDQGTNQTNPSASCGAGSTLSWTNSFSVNAPSTLKFRVYGFGATSILGTAQILNLLINGTVVAVSSCTAPVLSATPAGVGCNGQNNGAVNLTVTGGSNPISYLWSNGATSQNISSLIAGSYTVTATANGGCTSTASASVSQPVTLVAGISAQTNTGCSNAGSATVAGTGGTNPYSYSWSNSQTTVTATNLIPGNYNVTVTDANLCSASTSVSIVAAVPTILATSNITNTTAVLNWTAVSGAVSYNIQYRKITGISWTATTSNTNSLNLSGLSLATLYEFQVQAVCPGGSTGSFSGLGSFTTTGGINNCSAPTILSASNITPATAKLNWNVALGAHSYNVQYRLLGATTWTTGSSVVNSLAISGLTAGATYQFQVQTVCAAGTSGFSAISNFTTGAACPTPTGLTITNITNTTALLNWGVVTGAASYNIRYRQVGTTTWTTATSTTNSLAISGLTGATNYAFQVQTVCTGGTPGNFSTSGTFTTGPGTNCSLPTGLSESNITNTSATLTWGAVSGAVSYNIQYRIAGTSTWTSQTSATNSLTISGLTSGTNYEFQVQTVCSGGASSFTASATFTTTGGVICATPTGLTVSSITSTSALVTWNAVAGALRYNVQYRVVGTSTWTTDTSSSVTYGISGLSPSANYEFQAQTLCSTGTGAFSSSATFTTAGPCASAPLGFSVSNITMTTATLNWLTITGVTSYNIQYRVSGTTTWTTTSSIAGSKNISSLTAGTTYEFQVQAVCSGGSSSFSTSSVFVTSAALPRPDHVVVVMMENHSYSQIVGSSAAPNINTLIADTDATTFSSSYAITHPSQPNYIDLFSGNNQGITTDNLPSAFPFTAANLARELLDSSLTYTTYSEGLPSVGFNGDTSGLYARKHNPAANWMGTGTNQIPTTTNQPFTAFPANYTTLPTVSFVIPNLVNDMHNGSGNSAISAGDTWYQTYIHPYVVWAETHNSLLILQWDEDDNSPTNQIATIFAGQMVKRGTDTSTINHYNVLRTIEDMYKLGHAGSAASATPITNCWKQVQQSTLPTCDFSLWNHVYHNYRLIIHDTCTYITGTVDHLIYEADGDIHIRVNVDTAFKTLLNSGNIANQYGDLVVEPICATTVTQADAVSSCQGFVNTVYIPNVGEHVKVTGSYVTDNDHGWNEIHPITSIVITTQTAQPVRAGEYTGVNDVADDDYISVKVSPNPTSDYLIFNVGKRTNDLVYIEIMDGIGRNAGQYQLLATNELQITTSYLPAGVYYYNVKLKDRVMNSGKFVVVH